MTVLFVVATILFFLGIDWVVQHRKQKAMAPAEKPQTAGQSFPLRVPEGIFFTKSHTWLSLFPSGKVRLGLDDFVAGMLEDPKVTLLKSAGEQVRKGDALMVLEQGGRQMTVRSPLAGTVVASNQALEKDAGLMREELFSLGWAYTLQPAKPEEVRGLMLGDESRNWMASELRRLRELFAGIGQVGLPAPATLQDGGAPAPGALKHLGATEWQKFEEMFLQVQ